MFKNYMLEIYMPKSCDDVWVSFDSDYPLPSIHPGDLLNPYAWETPPVSSEFILRVTNVEHLIWKHNDQMRYKLMVFTEDVANIKKKRKSNPK